jgi:hypothetical protein
MGSIISLKKWFQQKDTPQSYKRAHFLNQLMPQKLEEILLFSEGDALSSVLPGFENKKVLFFNDQRHKYVFRKVLAGEPRHLVNYVYKGGPVAEQRPGFHTVMGDATGLALRRDHFDVILCPFVLEDAAFVENFVRAIAGFLANGSRMILSVRHPQTDNALFNQNPASSQVAEASVARYHALLKEQGLFTEEIHEGGVDLALKAFFSDVENDHYHEYKNTGVSLVFRAVKFVKKKSA